SGRTTQEPSSLDGTVNASIGWRSPRSSYVTSCWCTASRKFCAMVPEPPPPPRFAITIYSGSPPSAIVRLLRPTGGAEVSPVAPRLGAGASREHAPNKATRPTIATVRRGHMRIANSPYLLGVQYHRRRLRATVENVVR